MNISPLGSIWPQLQLAGMAPKGARRDISRPVAGATWDPLPVEDHLVTDDEGRVCVRLKSYITGPNPDAIIATWVGEQMRENVGVVGKFTRLSNDSDADVLKFALKFGGLGLMASPSDYGWAFDEKESRWSGGLLGDEPVSYYRTLASHAWATIALAADLHRQQKGKLTGGFNAKAWRVLAGHRPGEVATTENVRGTVASAVNVWIDNSKLRPWIEWEPNSPARVVWRTPAQGLLGVVALQLFVTVSRARAIATCAACGSQFEPTRSPRGGQASWCPEPECRKAMRAQKTRDSRARKRSATAE